MCGPKVNPIGVNSEKSLLLRVNIIIIGLHAELCASGHSLYQSHLYPVSRSKALFSIYILCGGAEVKVKLIYGKKRYCQS